MEELRIIVKARPVGQPRPRAARFGNNIRIYNPPTADEWRLAVELAAVEAARNQEWEPTEEPLGLRVVFWMPRPKAHHKASGELKDSAPTFCHTKPDLDNLLKSTTDALETSGIVVRDQQVVAIEAVKLYGPEGAVGANLTLSEATSCTNLDNHG